MRRFLALAGLTCGLAVLGASDSAEACGGCFVPESGETIVTGHRMALSISQTRTVLWDQIQYTGNAQDFSWVLPVKPGAVLEVANDAWFDVLEAATRTNVQGRPAQCFDGFEGGGDFVGGDSFEGGERGGGSGTFGCGSSAFEAVGAPANGSDFGSSGATGGGFDAPPEDEPVEVVSETSAGPYDIVTLSTDVPGALNEWLDEKGFVVPPEMQPVIDAYVAEGFDFIAMRLSPDANVQQMKPVRVITPGSSFALPLKMVAAGTGANTALTLFMIGEGRYQAQNFDNVWVPQGDITWDYASSSSDYSELRVGALAQNGGRSWLTSYARRGSLLGQVEDDLSMSGLRYNVGNSNASTIAEAYVMQGIANGEGDTSSCLQYLNAIADDMGVVVDDLCEGEDCTNPPGSEIPASDLACGDLDDVATALVGMHPRDVWITRMEANLPRRTLDSDLMLEASLDQNTVENRFFADKTTNHPCSGQSGEIVFSKPPTGPSIPGGIGTLVLAGALAGLVARRRREVATVTR